MYLLTSALAVVKTTPSGSLFLNQATIPSVFRYVLSDGDSQLQRWSSLIGIVTAIVGNILISFALNIQRYAHIKLNKEGAARKEKARNAAKGSQIGFAATRENSSNGNQAGRENRLDHDDEEDNPLQQSFHSTDSQLSLHSYDGQQTHSNYLRSPYWWGGIVLMTLGEAGNFLAYGFAPASIVSPLGVVALISNCVIAPIMLKEDFRMRDFWGVVIAVAGAVTVVLSSKQQEKKLGPHEIWDAITTTEFEVYMAVTVALVGVLIWASPKYGKKTILIDLGLVGLFGMRSR
jgi:drug/metabolite transporter (DMT)-like permease